mmetsp:Transcript_158158/g.384098  ORF Transcript_158158/g.384098 Transcript_158158/m.384098 type:complete len:319 (-) Transcript_158158:273-1229(-)
MHRQRAADGELCAGARAPRSAPLRPSPVGGALVEGHAALVPEPPHDVRAAAAARLAAGAKDAPSPDLELLPLWEATLDGSGLQPLVPVHLGDANEKQLLQLQPSLHALIIVREIREGPVREAVAAGAHLKDLQPPIPLGDRLEDLVVDLRRVGVPVEHRELLQIWRQDFVGRDKPLVQSFVQIHCSCQSKHLQRWPPVAPAEQGLKHCTVECPFEGMIMVIRYHELLQSAQSHEGVPEAWRRVCLPDVDAQRDLQLEEGGELVDYRLEAVVVLAQLHPEVSDFWMASLERCDLWNGHLHWAVDSEHGWQLQDVLLDAA